MSSKTWGIENDRRTQDILASFLNACRKQQDRNEKNGTCKSARLPFVNFDFKENDDDSATITTKIRGLEGALILEDKLEKLAHEEELLARRLMDSEHFSFWSSTPVAPANATNCFFSSSGMTCTTTMPKKYFAEKLKAEKEEAMKAEKDSTIESAAFVRAYFDAIPVVWAAGARYATAGKGINFIHQKENGIHVVETKLEGREDLLGGKAPHAQNFADTIKSYLEGQSRKAIYKIDQHTKCSPPQFNTTKDWSITCRTILDQYEWARMKALYKSQKL